MEKRFRVTHQKVYNLIGKVNKHVVLRLRLDSMALRFHSAGTGTLATQATVLEVSLLKEARKGFSLLYCL